MKTLLVPIDFSTASEQVVHVAAELAHALGGSAVLLHAVWVPPSFLGYEMETEKQREFADELTRTATEGLRLFLPTFESRGVTATAMCLIGRPASVILEQAKNLPADYIVIGSHGHTAIYDLVLGSATSGVIKRASCPVVVVPLQQASRGNPNETVLASRSVKGIESHADSILR